MASRGESDKVDMLVGDIYGHRYSKFQLSAKTLASSFGKIGGMKAPRGPDSGVGEEDLAKALLVMITMNIGQVRFMVHRITQSKSRVIKTWGRFYKAEVFPFNLLSNLGSEDRPKRQTYPVFPFRLQFLLLWCKAEAASSGSLQLLRWHRHAQTVRGVI